MCCVVLHIRLHCGTPVPLHLGRVQEAQHKIEIDMDHDDDDGGDWDNVFVYLVDRKSSTLDNFFYVPEILRW